MQDSESKKLLICAPAWVGDMVMAHTLVTTLIDRYEGAEIHMLAPAATLPLASRMPGVAGGISFDVAHGELGLKKRRAMGLRLREQGFSQAYVLPNSLKSALVPFFARIPKRTGWQGEARYGLLNDRRRLDKERYPLMIERFMALGREPGDPLPRPYPDPILIADTDNRDRVLGDLGLSADQPIVVLCPGAEFGPAKRWPSEHFAAVAAHARDNGYQIWLMGSPKDHADCAEICEIVPEAVNIAGQTSLIDAVDLMSLAYRVVCNDSGLMHVACALGCQVVALYGSTSPGFTPPLGQDPVILSENLDCSPCFERTCPLGHLNCLNQLAPQRVIEVL
jgi:heptosyltransferase-2